MTAAPDNPVGEVDSRGFPRRALVVLILLDLAWLAVIAWLASSGDRYDAAMTLCFVSMPFMAVSVSVSAYGLSRTVGRAWSVVFLANGIAAALTGVAACSGKLIGHGVQP